MISSGARTHAVPLPSGDDKMVRCSVLMFILMSLPGIALAASEERVGAAPVCLYDSNAYSDGAYICIQKFLMQVCASDGVRATWKAIADKDINDRCTAPMAFNHPVEHRGHGRRHAIRRAGPIAERSAKCFMFNGREYCE
jgi:hypothetical protein